jgi:N-ethylmaleimide reductase
MSQDLFSPVQLGELSLNNRMVMAPMTRARATRDGFATDIMAKHYAQRASAGLVVTEGVYPSEQGKGYFNTPGIANDAQASSWQKVVEGVHQQDGKMVMQLMHCGRIAHPLNRKADLAIVAPSAIKPKASLFTHEGMKALLKPQALLTSEIQTVIDEYSLAAKSAMAIGFDGIELHCTSGYLPAQFLASNSNQRSDSYGGSTQCRCRFVLELIEALVGVVGSGRLGLRIGIGNTYNDHHDDNPAKTYQYLLKEINFFPLAYIHALVNGDFDGDTPAFIRNLSSHPIMLNDGYNKESANAAIKQGNADAVSFGRAFIANPDLVERFLDDFPLNVLNDKTLYQGGEKGYIDYPLIND